MRSPGCCSTLKLVLLWATVLPVVTAASAPDPAPAPFSFKIRRTTATVHLVTEGHAVVDRLRITFSDPAIPEQIIPCGDEIELMPEHAPPDFESADYDRDGYHDFSLLDSSSSAPNFIRHFFFYSPGARRFVRRPDVDAAGVSAYDPGTGVFTGYWRSGPEAWGRSYRFEGGKLRLFREVKKGRAKEFRDILPYAHEDDPYIVTTIYLSNGRVRRFYRYHGP